MLARAEPGLSVATGGRSIILMVDDDANARFMLRSLLTPEGHQLLEASNGHEALQIVAGTLPDLVLLDVMMPDLDGFTLCARLRELPLLREVPILLITSLNDRESRLRGLTVGADGFLSKPFDHAELLAQVRTITRLNRYRRLLAEQERFVRLIQLSPDGIAILDAADRFLLVNQALVALLGVESDEALRASPITAFLTPEGSERYHKCLAAISADRQQTMRSELTMKGRTGQSIAVEVSVGHFGDGDHVQVIFRDITPRKQAELQIQRQLTQLTSLHSIGVAITASLDLKSTLTRLLDSLTEQLEVDACSVLMLNRQTGLLEPAASKGLNLPASQHFLLRSDEGLAGTVFQTERPISAPNYTAQDPRCLRDRVLSSRFASYFALPLRARGEVQGVLELLRRDPFTPDHHWWLYIEALSVQAAIAIHTATLFEQLQLAHIELTHSYNATIEGWSRALDLRDHETEGHSVRVTELTLTLARHLGIGGDELEHIRRGALLHDIGKMGVPDRILLKPGPLSADEWVVMRRHPTYAFEWLAVIPFLQQALAIPYGHHEKWDGTGYPRGLKGEQIPLAARIFAIVDVWDALRSNRPYRQAWNDEQVIAYIRQLSGTHFDPRVVRAFTDLMADRIGQW